MRQAKRKSRVSRTEGAEREVIKQGIGKFTYPNGDSYEGQYVVINKKEIYRHGHGVYKTHDGDSYEANWYHDNASSNFRATYGSRAEYVGELDDEGAMSGRGTYVFPDGTSLTATWKDNQPNGDFHYVDPLGYKWLGRLAMANNNDQEAIVFAPVNRVWTALRHS